MSDLAISVEGLSKSYLIGHNTQNKRYTTLRDMVTRDARNLARRTRDILLGRAIVQADQTEEFWALKDVAFEVRRGETLGIIGRNGAGKSTLLKILSRITEPTAGRIRIAGRVASLLEVGTGFHPELTGRENIFLNGAILGMTRAEITRKFDEIVDFAEVEKFLDTPVKFFSSGMYVRLAFAVAAHLEPEILVVDEVLAVGDAQFQKKSLGKMGEIANGGRTVLFVSHNMTAIRRLCARCIYLENGSVSFDGDTALGIQKYHGRTRDRLFAAFQHDEHKIIQIRQLEIVVPGDLSKTDEIDTANGLKIRVNYTVNQPITGAHVFLRIHMQDGETLLSTGDADTSPTRLELRRPGQYVCEVFIPPRILGEGQYTITWSAGVPFQENFDVAFHALAFRIVDNQTPRAHFIHKARPGFLALDIDWNYENCP
ncbi:MAG: ABC transporter ATP-binding protein [Rhodocyclales bacterium]|nr:ABC transporter ATP-binding protein [Rhodocyclales bacterium]